MTLLESVNKFIDNISITDYQDDSVNTSFSNLESSLTSEKCNLAIKEVFMNGSYLRRTIIRPLDDIDVFVVFDDEEYSKLYNDPNPQTILNRFKSYIDSLSDYKGKCRQSRPCITIDLSDKHIDVLPTMKKNGVLYIPNEDLSGWDYTDPKLHTENLNRINKNRKYMVKKVVKAIKKWKKINNIKIASFHIEQIAIQIFGYYDFINVREGIELWYNNAGIYLKSNLCGTINQYNETKKAISNVKDKLNNASEFLKSGQEREAKDVWKDIFGGDFPKYDSNEARSFGKALQEGSLKYGATVGLSTTVGNSIAASNGFYGEDSKA